MSKFNDGYEAGYAGGYQIGFNEGMDYAGQKVKPEPEPSPTEWAEAYSLGQKDASAYYEKVTKWLEVSVDPKGAGHTYKLRVPGGWLFRTVTYRYPELHKTWDEAQEMEHNGEGDVVQIVRAESNWEWKECIKAMEIATQTTVFVPEAT